MAEAAPPANGNETPDQPVATSGGSSTIMRIAALMFLSAVVFGECLVAYLLISRSGTESPAVASSPAPTEETKTEQPKTEPAATEHGKAEAPSPSAAAPESKSKGEKGGTRGESESEDAALSSATNFEIDLEQFGVTAHQPTSNTTTRIDFHLYGIVAAKDKEEFDRLLKANHHRFREQVLVTLRSSEASDLADAGLGLIKRQILEKTNALLGKPLLKAVIVSDFSYLEQ